MKLKQLGRGTKKVKQSGGSACSLENKKPDAELQSGGSACGLEDKKPVAELQTGGSACSLENKKPDAELQTGGVATSCVGNDIGDYLSSSCNQANLHNLNPEANLGLAQGAGFLPGLGGGGCSEPAEPVTFEQYKEDVKKYLGGGKKKSSKKAGRKSSKKTKKASKQGKKASKKSSKQRGGTYYSTNPEEMIGGLPRIDKGDSCCKGAILGGKFVQGASGSPSCGNQMGAGESRRKSKTMRGGSCRSKPAEFPTSFEAESGNFSADNSDKAFDCKQPFWEAGCR